MRYIVKKTDDGSFEFTHIEEKETLDGNKVEVIKGKNTLNYEQMIETVKQLELDEAKTKDLISKRELDLRIKQFKEEVSANLDLIRTQISTLKEMIKEVEKIK